MRVEVDAQKYILEKIVRTQVYCHQSLLVEKLIEDEFFSKDDIRNLYIEGEEKCIYEWWAISSILAEELRQLKYPVIIHNLGCWMGRTSCSASLLEDHIWIELLEFYEKQELRNDHSM